ncbi:hypothetical protein SAMN05660464_3779 [Geodermatophilus dictyosporus]|uniref:Uncharacterized protein n=1 Tax=Geodermatophilus dictyosporus TaxID=1523247 RepID=A0A1I5RY11_9ACTN|nr:hypothetical protein SAMN05660464_3779 [Geodermatophilus dictyosporus]
MQQLLDDLTARSSAAPSTATIEDITGALAHLGRALTGLAADGLTPAASSRQRTATGLAEACTAAGRLWPPGGGPLTDLAGAAADLVGRDRDVMGRAHRWAATVELAAAADHCARLGRRLLPPGAAPELAFVRSSAADVEHDAQANPPTADGYAVLDRLVPLPIPSPGAAQVPALDAAVALVAALNRAQRAGDLTLRDFRAAVAAAEITSRYAAATAGPAGEDAGPRVLAGLAWQLVGRSSMVFHDGRQRQPGDRRGVVASSQALVGALRDQVGVHADTPGPDEGRASPSQAAAVQQVADQLPALADRLAAAVDRWSCTGRLYANARDLPPMEDMPADRVRAVMAGRHVQAHGADLDRLRLTVGRAAVLTTRPASARAGADAPNRRADHPAAARHAPRSRAPVVTERMPRPTATRYHNLSTIRHARQAPREVPPSR